MNSSNVAKASGKIVYLLKCFSSLGIMYKQNANIKILANTNTESFKKEAKKELLGWTSFGLKGSTKPQDNNKETCEEVGCIK